MQTVTFEAGEAILSEGEHGDTAYLIVSGSVEISIGSGAKAKTLATLSEGDVFGEMSLIEPGPRSATVRAITEVRCRVMGYDSLLEPTQADLGDVVLMMKTLVHRLRRMNEQMADLDPEIGPRMQRWLTVILAGLDEQNALSLSELEILQRELRLLLRADRLDAVAAEVEKAEQVLSYMLRPSIEECLTLWFGKSEATDREIWTRFGADVGLASRGEFDHWALNVDHPRLLVALVIMLDQFRRNMYRETPEMYSSDARALSLVKRGLRVGVAKNLRPIERVFLCLVLTHSEALEDQLLCMEEWERAMEDLAPDDPLNVFHAVFQRHVVVIQRFSRFPHRDGLLGRESTPAEEAFLAEGQFRFDLPLVRQPDGTLSFVGTIRGHVPGQVLIADGSLLAGAGEAEDGSIDLGKARAGTGLDRARSQLRRQGFLRIGDRVPDIAVETGQGRTSFQKLLGNGWCVLVSFPAAFTAVAATELAAAARLGPDWERRGTTIVALSVDGVEAQRRWIQEIVETQGIQIDFPIIADEDRRVAMLLGLLDPTTLRTGVDGGETVTAGSMVVISPARQVELILTYPVQVGRNFEEILRVLDALQLAAAESVTTPAGWLAGQEALPRLSATRDRTDLPSDGRDVILVEMREAGFEHDPSLRVL